MFITLDHQNGGNANGLRRYPKGTVPANLQALIKTKNA